MFQFNLSISQRSLRRIIIWLTIRCRNFADCGLRSETSRLAKFMHEHKLKWLLVSSNIILRIHEGFIEQICSEVAILLGTFVSKLFSSIKEKKIHHRPHKTCILKTRVALLCVKIYRAPELNILCFVLCKFDGLSIINNVNVCLWIRNYENYI